MTGWENDDEISIKNKIIIQTKQSAKSKDTDSI